MSRCLKLVPFVLIAALVGCSKPESKFVGHYDAKIEVDQALRDKVAAAGPQATAMLEQQLGAAQGSLNLFGDGTYSGRQSGTSKGNRGISSGKWTESGGTITMTGNGKGEKTETVTGSEDGNTLTMTFDSLPGAKLVFTKSGPPVK